MAINRREGGAVLLPLVLDMHRRTGYGRTHQPGERKRCGESRRAC
jgi:hypothetical protein